jgi:hypothetical protein
MAAATAEHFSTVTLAALGGSEQREFLRFTLGRCRRRRYQRHAQPPASALRCPFPNTPPAAPRDRYGKSGSGLSFNAADTPLRFVSCGS